jgi:hypothetical protein
MHSESRYNFMLRTWGAAIEVPGIMFFAAGQNGWRARRAKGPTIPFVALF